MTPLGHQHEEFTAWAREQGVEINGVEPAKFPGRGLGVIARCKIEVKRVNIWSFSTQAEPGARLGRCLFVCLLLLS